MNTFLLFRRFRSHLPLGSETATTAVTSAAKITKASLTGVFFQPISSLTENEENDGARSYNNKNQKLTTDEVDASLRLIGYQGTPFPWVKTEDCEGITKTFHFADFNQAWSFMTRSALLAEKMDHHPWWSNVYNEVQVKLTTHDCAGVSQKDIDMARAMEAYASDLMPDGKKFMLAPIDS